MPLRKLKLQFKRNPDGATSVVITLTFFDGLVVRLDDIPLRGTALEVIFSDIINKDSTDNPTGTNSGQKVMSGRRKTEDPPMRKMRYRGLERHERLAQSQRQVDT